MDKHAKNPKRISSALIGLLSFLFLRAAHAETNPSFYAVQVSANVSASPANITLQWQSDGNATSYAIYRKNFNATSWNSIGSVGGGSTSFSDSNVSLGSAFEYAIIKSTSLGYQGTGYIYAGIEAPLTEYRGKALLIVDNTYASQLAPELTRMQQDLIGDGWGVIRHDVSRNDSVVSVKNIIRNDYNADPGNVKAVFLFGHVPVPYSGNSNPDGHVQHFGACPADVYYGDMDGNWTDSSVNNGSAEREANRNYPGDGKFDQSELPSDVELEVGRVDLSNMTCYANKSPSRSELDLLRQYLNKDHNFRHRVFTAERRGLICDNWGERNGEAFAASGWRNFAAFFGANNVTQVAGWNYFPTINANSYLWSHGGGGGGYTSCDGVGGSDDFANGDVKGVFTMFIGSFFGDWDNESNFLRAPLGSTSYCLTSAWAGRPHWFFHHMGLGETIGYSTKLTQNNGGTTYMASLLGDRSVQIALMGDPTLRMHPVVPPGNLNGVVAGNTVTLTWTPAADSDVRGYNIYRASSMDAQFARIGSGQGTSFVDASGSASAVYMVRTLQLEHSGSGTYYNLSQGVFFGNGTIGNGGGGGGGGGSTTGGVTPAAAPSNLSANPVSGSQVNLAWTDNANNESGFVIERKTGSDGAYAQIATTGANVTTFSNSGLAPATLYYFRIRASNSAGVSRNSNEANATTGQPVATTASASFVNVDSATQGNWKGVYGGDGFNVVDNVAQYPGYAEVSTSGADHYQWSDTTTDIRALQKVSGAQRISACWYAPSQFTIDLNLTDGQAHRIALYVMDWDQSGRNETIEVLDAGSGAALNTQTVGSFGSGKYLVWDLKGHVTVRVTRVTGPNAIVMGIFFGRPATGGSETPAGTSAVLTRGRFQLHVTGQVGDSFYVQSSDDLIKWATVNTITLTNSGYDYSDPNVSANTAKFYRTVKVP